MKWKEIITFALIIVIFLFGYLAGYKQSEGLYSINALRGKNPYNMEIIHKTHIINQDTLYSIDTLFVKKSAIKKEV